MKATIKKIKEPAIFNINFQYKISFANKNFKDIFENDIINTDFWELIKNTPQILLEDLKNKINQEKEFTLPIILTIKDKNYWFLIFGLPNNDLKNKNLYTFLIKNINETDLDNLNKKYFNT